MWRELAEELRQIPRLLDEAACGPEAGHANPGLLSALRQAAGTEEADQAAGDRVKPAEARAGLQADKPIARRSRLVTKERKTRASGFDPHPMLSRLSQPVTKLNPKVSGPNYKDPFNILGFLV